MPNSNDLKVIIRVKINFSTVKANIGTNNPFMSFNSFFKKFLIKEFCLFYMAH